MKTLIITLFLGLSLAANAQYFVSDLTDESVPVIWLGLDFGEAKVIAREDQELNMQRLHLLPNIWNDKVARQESKYPLKKAFHRSAVTRKIDMIKAQNSNLDSEQMVTKELHLLYNYTINTAISQYDLNGLSEGIGMVFLVEAIDFAHKEFSGYMIPIDLMEKRVIRTFYLKTRFSNELEEDELIEPFRQILLQYADKLNEKK